MRFIIAAVLVAFASPAFAGDTCLASPSGDTFTVHNPNDGKLYREGSATLVHKHGSTDNCGWLTSAEGDGNVWCAAPGSQFFSDVVAAEQGDYSGVLTWDDKDWIFFGAHWAPCK